MIPFDTIAAVASPAGRGAVGVIRISGPDVPRVAVALLGALPGPRAAHLRRFLDADGTALDEGIAVYFPAPASFTGEHVLELQGHGGAFIVDRVLKRVLEAGARMARPGEFSERAFLNGKMDLAQAEAVADLIDAGTTAAARAAVRSMRGEFSARIRELQTQLTALRVYVEAAIDFPDEEIDFLSNQSLQDRLSQVFAGFDSITAAARQGALLREGLNVVIAGPPNAGKSSLLNRLVGDEVAIVTSLPGTTRDVLRQQVHFDGLPINLIDTAGLRMAADVVEEEGIRRAKSEIERADRVLYVVDAAMGSLSPAAELPMLPAAVPVVFVMNKIDLLGTAPRVESDAACTRIYLSAQTGAGIPLLRDHVKASAGYRDGDSGALSARRRHLDALHRARQSVESAADALRQANAIELFAEDLRLAQRNLSEITGDFTSEDLLGEIFGSFCIGK
ncbi:MAG TPA: tRNA uridine-5-carboxymethylaminomethyl(34) synthesis GTPase MnmE [Steroidobacteraceae bacterium]|nr:tRNA uridine-5-carboxymethylaminomethyl(34) synthesis GTPase MnmE [Steroidobacteraceae bacterium]